MATFTPLNIKELEKKYRPHHQNKGLTLDTVLIVIAALTLIVFVAVLAILIQKKMQIQEPPKTEIIKVPTSTPIPTVEELPTPTLIASPSAAVSPPIASQSAKINISPTATPSATITPSTLTPSPTESSQSPL